MPLRYELIYCGDKWVKAWPLLQNDGSRRWKCENCSKLLEFVVTHEPLHPIAPSESRRPPAEVAFGDSTTKGGSSMREATSPVGLTSLQEHTNAMKLVLEEAAQGLTEFQWYAFAAITEKALKMQRAPR